MTALLLVVVWTLQATFWIIDKLLRVAFWIIAWIIALIATLIANYLEKKEANHGRTPPQEGTGYTDAAQEGEGNSAPQEPNPFYSDRR